MKITFFANGMNMAFEDNEQVPVAQMPWILVFVEYLVSQGIDPTEHEIELPNRQRAKILKFVDDDNGEIVYNWEPI